MSNVSTYSFADIAATFSHPAVGQYSFQGEGLGGITVAKASDDTQHDPAADGSVMVSKMEGNNGSITINVQQTSPAHDFLRGWYNYVKTAKASEWTRGKLVIKSPVMGVTHTATGISPQKRPDAGYEAAGKMVSWVLMAADIQEV